MPRDTITLEIPIAAGNGAHRRISMKAESITHVHVGGMWGTGENIKVQYIEERRTDEDDAWTDAAGGNITGITDTWVMRTEDIPPSALYVRIVAAGTVTKHGTYPPLARLIYDEGDPG